MNPTCTQCGRTKNAHNFDEMALCFNKARDKRMSVFNHTLNEKDIEELTKGNIEWFDPMTWASDIVNAVINYPILIESSKRYRELMSAALQETSLTYTYIIGEQQKEINSTKKDRDCSLELYEKQKKIVDTIRAYISILLNGDPENENPSKILNQIEEWVRDGYDPGKDIVHD